MKPWLQKNKLLLIGIAIASAYGVLMRIFLLEQLGGITFLFIVPSVLGVIPLLFASNDQLKSNNVVVFIPIVTVWACFVVMSLTQLEGFICLLIIGLPFLLLSVMMALIYRSVRQYFQNKKRGTFITLILIPFIASPLEEVIHTPTEIYTVKREVIIDGSAEYIWQNIIRVAEIKDSEYTPGTFNYLGIPRPIEAELDTCVIGGIRTGHFEGGLLFNETITECVPNKKITFDIIVDPKTVRAVVFDQHVLNGNYFSFVNASYELEPINDKQVKLRLTSGYRLTSKINFYSKFWGDIILEDFQDRLLQVIKNRCDAKGYRTATLP